MRSPAAASRSKTDNTQALSTQRATHNTQHITLLLFQRLHKERHAKCSLARSLGFLPLLLNNIRRLATLRTLCRTVRLFFYLFLNCDFWLLNIDVAILSRLRERVYDRFAAPWLCGFRCCDCEIGVALGSLDTSLSKLISSFRAEPFQSCERNKRSGQSSHHDCRSSTARGLQLAEALQEQGQQSDERVIDYEWNQRSRHSQLW